ncbi:NAD-dependent epimerase/dehydratase family protein [Saccharopolyspora sp. HNM0986]|uniref:NAD-dependent epimerase/dehydratase family protein n=1 Tax=Saccharopolyspora galaxeae TaxID=2781241 RepID=UPI00190ACD1A|nr:NAD-dependent epimerase/dehydratase family protein [Saccharopolyspora sp. HNM0986]MBK0869146.1 NAD-dependent epimerase/dehydratase family protein [Saccharopolyspora sp. HNM0986]
MVTGGSGFVGRAVVRAFVERGTPVTVADEQPLPASLRGDLVRHVAGDLTDPQVREAAVPEGTAGIVHLAAITSVLRSVDRPDETYRANVEVTHELLELARRRHAGQFVLASTNAVVGDIGRGTISEQLPLQPLTPYGATKAACEMLLSGYAGAYGIATTALRFTNIYGPGMNHKDSFIPRLMRAALSGGGVEVYGDGAQSRDFVHVDDVVQGILAAWDKQYTGPAIIGSGRSISVLELIEAVRAATGEPLPITHVPAKNGEMPAVIVDVAKAGRELGYTPSVELTDGLRTVWEDFRAVAAEAP